MAQAARVKVTVEKTTTRARLQEAPCGRMCTDAAPSLVPCARRAQLEVHPKNRCGFSSAGFPWVFDLTHDVTEPPPAAGRCHHHHRLGGTTHVRCCCRHARAPCAAALQNVRAAGAGGHLRLTPCPRHNTHTPISLSQTRRVDDYCVLYHASTLCEPTSHTAMLYQEQTSHQRRTVIGRSYAMCPSCPSCHTQCVAHGA